MRRKARDNEFGALVSQIITSERTNRVDVADKIGVSLPYLASMMSGSRRPTALYVDLIADVTNAPDDVRVNLHQSAAKANGFRIDIEESK